MSPPRRLSVQRGQRFGRGVVIDPQHSITRPSKTIRAARLLCDCGTEYEAGLGALFDGRVRSCGCLQSEVIRTHGLSSHALYRTWHQMVTRCEDERHRSFSDYGGRGISVCPEWHDVTAFIVWIEANLGPRPDGMTLDRVDNDGNYEPGNVQWATASEQRRNRRDSAGRRHS